MDKQTVITVYDIIPAIHKKLGDRCPDDEILKVVINTTFQILSDYVNNKVDIWKK